MKANNSFISTLILVVISLCLAGCGKTGKGTGPHGEYTPEDAKRDEIIADAAVGIATAMFQPPPPQPTCLGVSQSVWP